MKKYNIWIVEDILAVSFVITLVFAINRGKYSGAPIITAVAFIVIILLLKFCRITETVVKNNSSLDYKAKDENESNKELITIKSGETVTGIDGVKIKDTVYKFVTGTHVTINENGKPSTSGIIASILNNSYGGKRPTPPDEKWQKLFDAE